MSDIQLRASDSDAVKYIAARASDLLALLPALRLLTSASGNKQSRAGPKAAPMPRVNTAP